MEFVWWKNEDEFFKATLQHVFLEHNDATQVHGGSQQRCGPNIVKYQQLGEERIMHNCFCENSRLHPHT